MHPPLAHFSEWSGLVSEILISHLAAVMRIFQLPKQSFIV